MTPFSILQLILLLIIFSAMLCCLSVPQRTLLALNTLDLVLQGIWELPSASKPAWREGLKSPAHTTGQNRGSWKMLGLCWQMFPDFPLRLPYPSLQGRRTRFPFGIGRLFRCSPRVYEQKVTGLFSKGHRCQLERKRLQKATARCSFFLMVRNSLTNDGRPRTSRRPHSPRSTLTCGSFFVTLTSTFNDSYGF